jgi:hypothetical protein
MSVLLERRHTHNKTLKGTEMNENSLTHLSDFFADAIESKFATKSNNDILRLWDEVNTYEKTWKVWCDLYQAKSRGENIDENDYKSALTKKDKKFMALSCSLNYEELELKCIHAQPISSIQPINILLVYCVKVGALVMFFQCQAGQDGVFNYSISAPDDVGIDNALDYYFQHTPSAIF